MTVHEIPLTPEPQTFGIALAGMTYQVKLYWNVPNQIWTIDFLSGIGIPILCGIPLVTNVDLLAQYPDLNFGGKLVAQTDSAPVVPPTYDDLGLTGHLYFVTS